MSFIDRDLPGSVALRLESTLYGAPLSTAAYTARLVVMSIALRLRTGDLVLTTGAVASIVLIGLRAAYVARMKPSSTASASWPMSTQ